MIKINRLPAYALDCEYIVACRVNGALWFHGAWNDREGAMSAALLVNGEVFTRQQVEG